MYPNLRAEMARKGVTMTDIAEVLGIRLATLSHRMNGKSGFYYDETVKIKKYLDVEMPLEELFKTEKKEV